jgi:hypothetical protein
MSMSFVRFVNVVNIIVTGTITHTFFFRKHENILFSLSHPHNHSIAFFYYLNFIVITE